MIYNVFGGTLNPAQSNQSTKLEVHNILQEQDRAMCVGNMHKNLVMFGHVVFKLCERIDRQTDRHTHHNTLHPSQGKVNIPFIHTASAMIWRCFASCIHSS